MSGAASSSHSFSLWCAYSVWFRQFQAYKRTWLVNCLPSLTEPLVYLLAFGVGLGPVIGELQYHGSAVPYLSFLAPGMLGIAVVSQSYFEGAYGVYVRFRYERSWQALLAGPLTFEDIFLGETLWAATKGMIGCTATALVAYLFGVYSLSAFLHVLPFLICASVLFASLGLFTAGIIRSIDQINVPTFLFIIPMMVICGTYFPRDGLPPYLRIITALMPLSALNNLLRLELVHEQPSIQDVGTLLVWMALGCWLGFRQIRRRVML
jgi:lipooligosaccharide transport system permease protein